VKPIRIACIAWLGIATLSGCGDRARDAGAQGAATATASDEAAKASARAEADAALEVDRLAALWSYYDVPAGKGRQLSAAIYSKEDVDSDGRGARRVRLVFRDHPSWGKSAYLVLEAGDFNCYGGCTVPVTVDDAPPKKMAAHRPRTDEAIAMFVNDAQALWRTTRGASLLSIQFPVKAGGTRTATFEVAGLDRSKLPAWNTAP
jgi:hypothetical protein